MSDEHWIDEWQRGVEERLSRARVLASEVRKISGHARSGGGLVEAVVDSSGALAELRLDEAVRRHSARWIAEQVLVATRAARGDAAEQKSRLTRLSGEAPLTDLAARFDDPN